MPLTGQAKRDYQRRLMRDRRQWGRVQHRYLPYVDGGGRLPVVVLTPFRLWSSQLSRGEVCRLHLKLAARLELAGFVEVIRPPGRMRPARSTVGKEVAGSPMAPPEGGRSAPVKEAKEIAGVLKAIDRALPMRRARRKSEMPYKEEV